MSGICGKNFRLSIFGESHGKGIGIVIDGLPGGISLNLDYIKDEMRRRAPGNKKISTSRKEKDKFEILSGYFNNKTTGTPICCVIRNNDKRSRDYEAIKNIMRPGHADYTGNIKYYKSNDYRGGGHFSGRLTAPLVFAGAIAKQILEKENVIIGSHIKSVGNIEDEYFDWISINTKGLRELSQKDFPVINSKVGKKMKNYILEIKENHDSIGGIVETAVINLEAGVGEPFFNSIESNISRYLFSVPAVKGIEFGAGFNITKMTGLQANDEYHIDKGKITTTTNNNGGILGGISNGMPIIFRAAIKPTPSIGKTQGTVDIEKKQNINFKIEGRHDPCILPRVVPVIESVTAISILDLLIERKGVKWMI